MMVKDPHDKVLQYFLRDGPEITKGPDDWWLEDDPFLFGGSVGLQPSVSPWVIWQVGDVDEFGICKHKGQKSCPCWTRSKSLYHVYISTGRAATALKFI